MVGVIPYIVVGLLLGALGAWFMSRYAFTLGLVDLPNNRSSHVVPTPRGGGVGLFITFVLFANILNIPANLWLPATLLALVSFLDDRLELSAKVRLFVQLAAAGAVVFGAVVTGFSLHSLLSLPFWLFFIVGTANFYNFMDGINGIASIAGVVGFGLISFFSWMTLADSGMIFLSTALAAACVGFLPFNLPEARVFMGDVGSILLGFVFACLVYSGSSDFASFICLVSFMFPFFADTLTTLFLRWRDGEQLFLAHRRHLYQLLCNEFGLPHWQVACGFGLVQLIVGGGMLICFRVGLVWQVAFVCIVTSLFVFINFKLRGIIDSSRC
jgi:Fuc2NAc and GlcNAc transferase